MSCVPVRRVDARARAPRRFGAVSRAAARVSASSSVRGVSSGASAFLGGGDAGRRALARRPAPRPPRRRDASLATTRACWSLEVSVATSAFVAGAVATLLSRGDRRARGHALFLGVFGSMQLVDAFLWFDQAHATGGLAACDLTNRVATRAGLAIICLEPLAAMLAAHVVADKKPHPAVVAAYLGIFILTPLSGTSLLSHRAPCADVATTLPIATIDIPRSGGGGGGGGGGGYGYGYGYGFEPTPGVGFEPTPVAADRPEPSPSCSPSRVAFGPTWLDLMTGLEDPCVCTSVTPQGHLLYGGLDLVYHRGWTRWLGDEPAACALDDGSEVFATREIPLALRLLFLGAMAVPYGVLVTPRTCGAAHAGILVATWLIGASSDAAASVWCVANVAQGILMLCEPRVWPETAPARAPAPDRRDPGPGLGGTSPRPRKRRRLWPVAQAFPSGGDTGYPAGHAYGELPERRRVERRGVAGRSWPRFDAAAARRLAENPPDVVVVGSGAGGLAFAALVAKAGMRAVVFERHYRAGGCTHAFSEIGGGRDVFDTGIHYVGMGATFRRLLSHVSAPGRPMRFAVMGDESDGFAYDEIDLGRRVVRDGERRREASVERERTRARGPAGWGTSADLDCDEEDDEEEPDQLDEDHDQIQDRDEYRDGETGKKTRTVVDEEHERSSDRLVVTLRKGALAESLKASFPGEASAVDAYVDAIRASRKTSAGLLAAIRTKHPRGVFFDAFVDAVAPSGLDALVLAKLVPYGFGPVGDACRRFLLRRAERDARETAADAAARFTDDPALRATLSSGQMIDWNLPGDETAWPVAAGMMRYYEDGGYFPDGGSAQIAETMAEVIETRGGRDGRGGDVICAADVVSIVTDPDPDPDPGSGPGTNARAVRGVTVRVATRGTGKGRRTDASDDEGHFFIPCGVVVSAVGFENTFLRLVPRETLRAAGMDPREVTSTLRPSHGHVCAFVSLDGSARELGLRAANTHSFGDALGASYGYDVGAFSRDYYADPFRDEARDGAPFEPLITITCPSAKDPSRADDPTSTAILLAEAVPEWTDPSWRASEPSARPASYLEFKSRWRRLFLERLHRHYPETRGRVRHAEVSTPVTAERFLGNAASYGLEWTPAHFRAETQERWFSPAVRRVPGLFLTGECVAYGGFYGAVANAYVTASHVLGLARLATMMATDADAEPPVVREGFDGGDAKETKRRGGKDEHEHKDKDDDEEARETNASRSDA